MNNSIKVSIIISIYNTENYLKECLESIINQSYTNLEIICINDGSTDSSLNILKNYAQNDSRFIIINNTQNTNAGSCRNQGLEIATGKYCIFLDADDFFDKNLISLSLSKALKTNSDIVVFDSYIYDNATHNIQKRKSIALIKDFTSHSYFNYKNYPNIIMDLVLPAPWNKLYKTSFIKQNNLKFMSLNSYNDITFTTVSIVKAEKISYLQEFLVYYRINVKNSITSFKSKNFGDIFIAVEETIKQISCLHYYNEIKNSAIFFTINKYIFSLNNFLTNCPSAQEYYIKIHTLFNTYPYSNINHKNKFLYKHMIIKFLLIKHIKTFKNYQFILSLKNLLNKFKRFIK